MNTISEKIYFDARELAGKKHGFQTTNYHVAEELVNALIKESALVIQDFVDHRIPASEYPERLKKYFGVE